MQALLLCSFVCLNKSVRSPISSMTLKSETVFAGEFSRLDCAYSNTTCLCNACAPNIAVDCACSNTTCLCNAYTPKVDCSCCYPTCSCNAYAPKVDCACCYPTCLCSAYAPKITVSFIMMDLFQTTCCFCGLFCGFVSFFCCANTVCIAVSTTEQGR